MQIRHLTRTTQHLLFWGLISIALSLNVVRFFLTEFDDYQSQLAEKVRETTHLPIRIGKISSRMRHFSPALVLEDISFESDNPQLKPAIQLDEVEIGINLLQLLLSGDPVSSSWVTLVRAKIEAIRNPDGSIAIKGMPNDNVQPLWLLQGHQYQIVDSDISVLDLKNNGELINFKNLDLVLKNHQQDHEIHLITSLPEHYGESLRVSALLQGNLFETNHLQGQIYIEGVNLQGPALAKDNLPAELKLSSGSGDIRLWSDWQDSQPIKITGYIQAQQIRLNNAQGAALSLDTLEGNITWLQQQGGWRLGADNIDIVANRQRWVDGEVYLGRNQQNDWSLLIRKLDLQALAQLAPIFIKEPQYSDWLAAQPNGLLTDFAGFWQADGQKYALRGNFSQLGNQAFKVLPHLQGLSGQISGTEAGGRLDLTSADVLVDASAQFRNPLTIKLLLGSIDWRQQADAWLIRSKHLALNSPDFQTDTDFMLSIPKTSGSPTLDLRCRFDNFNDISKIPAYLPAKIMDKNAINWLDQAFIAGQIGQGELIVRGNLADFPFVHGQGQFDTLFNIDKAEIEFNPDWPHLYEVNTDLHFTGEDLLIAVHHAESKEVEVKQVIGKITGLATSTHVQINGQLQSKIQDALLYLQKTPLHGNVDPLLKILDFDSQTRIDLDLDIPFFENMPVYARVASYLENASLTLIQPQLKVSNINGVLNFTENQVSSKLTAKALGYPLQAQLSSDAAATHLKISGSSTVANLEKQFSFLKNELATGAFNYQAEVTVPQDIKQATTLEITSNLQGVSIVGEDFLSKSAEVQKALRLNFQFENRNLLPLQIQYGNELGMALLIDTEQNRLYSGHLLLGGNKIDTDPQAGLNIEVRQPEFKLSQAFSSLSAVDKRWPALREFALDTGQLIWQGQNLGAMRCRFQHNNQAWQGNIDSEMAKGHLEIADQNTGNEPIKLNMDTLNLSAMSVLNFNAAEQVITSLPLLEIDSRQVMWRSVNLGKLKLQTERMSNGVHFKKIKFSDAGKDIEFTADWVKQLSGSTTLLNGSLNMNGFGEFLAELGYGDDIKETHAELNFTGGWNAAPQQFALEKLNGQLQIKLSNGRIASIEPGLGRLLGLISMEQWAKRLSLDFSDIYRQGLAFDRISGDFKITNGIAYTDNLLIDAVAAKMKVSGSANLIDKTLNHQVAVIPKSSDALPIAGTIMDGVAQIITYAVTNDYKEGYFFGSAYRISGRWGDITVTPVADNDGLLKKTWRGLTDFSWLY